MFKNMLILGILTSANICQAFTEMTLWTISAGAGRVIEFHSKERLFCGNYCYSFSVVGRPDEIFVSPFREHTLSGLRHGKVKVSHSYMVYVLNLKSKTIDLMELERFLGLDIVFEDFPVRGHEAHPELKYGGNPSGHEYAAPIQRMGKEFVATLSSIRKTSEETTFGTPSIIPFLGRQKWFQKEKSHSGTFLLEIFDKGHPSRPIVQLQKEFRDLRRLPSIFEMASWTQGAEEPFLVVVDNESTINKGRGRILLIQPQ